MAKLRHLQDLLERIAQVDAARARTLVMKARAAGHFTTGGRGVNAPDMTPRDATNTLLLALQMEPPTEAGEAVTALRNVPLTRVGYDDGNDHDDARWLDQFRMFEADRFELIGEDGKHLLPDEFCGKPPATVGDALDTLFGSLVPFLNKDDRVTHHYRPGGSVVMVQVGEAGWKDERRPGPRSEGQRCWKLIFDGQDWSQYDDLGVWAERSAYHQALRALRDLIHDTTAEEADEVLADG